MPIQPLPTVRRNLYITIALAASSIGLFTACGIGLRDDSRPPTPPQPSPLVLSAFNTHFSPTVIGGETSQTLTVTNPADFPIAIGSIYIASAGRYLDTLSFVRTTNCLQQIAPHGACTIKVIFNPQHSGDFAANLVIHFDRGAYAPIKLDIVGTAQ